MSPGNATAIEPGKPQNPTTNKPPKPNSNSQDAECFNALKLHPRLIPSFLNNPCGLIDFLIRPCGLIDFLIRQAFPAFFLFRKTPSSSNEKNLKYVFRRQE